MSESEKTDRPSAPTGASALIQQVTAKNLQRMGYRRIVQLLVYLVIIPTVLLLSIGILLLVLKTPSVNLLFGILTVSFVSVVITGIVLTLVFVRREANLSELQADFVSKVSHELRTPLTAIRLFAETIQRPDADEATRGKCVGLMVAETERLSKLIERLLDWGRMESGRKIYELRNERVQAIIDDVVKAHAAQADLTRDLDFDVEVEPDLPDVTVDRGAMVDAIVNLLSNAAKYGGSPPVVRLTAKPGPDGSVAIAVKDNGEGIPPPEHRRIFDKFYRIDDRLSRTKEGSGLGLAIVKHIARAHHARVSVDSAPGKGSIFEIVLPPARKAEARGAQRSETSTMGGVGGT